MPSSPHPHSHSQPSPPQPQPQPQPQPPPPQPPPVQTTTVRKLIVEVIDARDLLPKDGQGSSSPYVVVDFDKQRKRTSSKFRDLNPSWNEKLDFIVSDPSTMQYEELVVEVYNDKRMSNASASAKKCHFLGRVKIYGSQFAKRGDEGLIYFALEKKSVFSWIRGEIGLKIYYYDEVVEVPANVDGGEPQQPLPEEVKKEEPPVVSVPIPIHMVEVVRDGSQSPPIVVIEESPPPATGATAGTTVVRHEHPPVTESNPTPVTEYPPEVRKVQNMRMEGDRFVKKPNGDFSPRIITGKFCGETEKIQPFDLVEPMQYLFIKIVKARNLPPNESPCIKIRSGNQIGRPKPAFHKANEPTDVIEWNRVFTLNHNNTDRTDTLEISVWDQNSDRFLGGVCFGLTDVPVRDPPDSPLAPQWYHLEGTDEHHNHGDIQLSVWIGTQADDAFPESINLTSDSQYVSYTRPKVYQSPKLWYLRVIVVEAQDLQVHTTPLMAMEIRVKAQLGFQSVRTRRGVMNNHTASFHWHEDLVFVACEPLEDQLILLVEDRTGRDPVLLGHVAIPVGTIEERLDERHLGTKWYSLEGGSGSGPYFGRLNLRLCLEGGYHVLDEAAHLSSDFRPTARQLWKPPVGILELGILGARGLLPMKSKSPGKGSTDAYCVAKYGKKWVRTRTVTDTFDPRWNEQYTWQVYDPCTVLTIGVFDNRRMFVDMAVEDCQIGKVRIRVSTLETNKVYTNSYPLMVLQRTGLRKIGEIELAVRFASPSILPETCATYGQPILPRMHYLRPLGVAQQEALRHAATKMVAAWLSRSEPPLGSEVVRYILDADSHTWSMRKSKANWFRIVAVLSWAVGLAKWLDDIRRWKNPVTTVLVHLLYLVLVWYPDLIVPTGILYVVLIGVWYHRFRPKAPAGMDIRMSQAEMVDLDELDEEFDTIPSSKPPEIIRIRYDRLRILASRVQTVLGDFATQGERVQALVSWRDPRATRLFIGVCLIVAMILYVVPPKMVAVALGFYYLRHPLFRDPMPPASLNFFRRLPSLSDRLM
ncbi:Phosphoribosyltransferase C-terminal [Dillenia turbinata]|uniref:Phosphoribosyltransferase C-terminal n=1 Tax=Dillenia turbinata TaxID=194707 RepID=A0AAN8V029_9MAGN